MILQTKMNSWNSFNNYILHTCPNTEHNHIIGNLKSIEKDKDQFNELDTPVTENELLNAVKVARYSLKK